MHQMPRSLRWLSAVSTAVVSLFAYTLLTLGIAKATGTEKLQGGLQLLFLLGGTVVPLIVALAVNDWLRERYGPPSQARPPSAPSSLPAKSADQY
jgi:hypothetical protein